MGAPVVIGLDFWSGLIAFPFHWLIVARCRTPIGRRRCCRRSLRPESGGRAAASNASNGGQRPSRLASSSVASVVVGRGGGCCSRPPWPMVGRRSKADPRTMEESRSRAPSLPNHPSAHPAARPPRRQSPMKAKEEKAASFLLRRRRRRARSIYLSTLTRNEGRERT
jgi:hypothetical protein